jgi:hypothetical protein
MFRKGTIKKSKPDNFNVIVLAEGEMTGHAHKAKGIGISLEDGILNAPNGAAIEHEEHKIVEVPAGRYRVSRIREQDHFAEEARQVRD